MRRRTLLFGLIAVACGNKPLPLPPAAPVVASAADFVPPDLDVVMRLDWVRMKTALGAAALAALSRQVLSQGQTGSGTAEPMVVASLLEADVVYVGYRPDSSGLPLDLVLALQGGFEQVRGAPAGFSGAHDLGRDLRYWDAKTTPVARGGVARIYAQGERVRAFVSEAELDAVERCLEGVGSPRRYVPPEEGTLSLALRPQLLARFAGSGTLRGLLEDAKSLTAVVELEADGAHAKLELLLADAEQARQLAEAGQQVLERALGGTGVAVSLAADGERVVVSTRLTQGQLGAALTCVRNPGSSECVK